MFPAASPPKVRAAHWTGCAAVHARGRGEDGLGHFGLGVNLKRSPIRTAATLGSTLGGQNGAVLASGRRQMTDSFFFQMHSC